jgi:hypothetical protein
MMSNNRRSALEINAHLLIEETCGEFYDCRKLEKITGDYPPRNVTLDFFNWGFTTLLKNQSYMYKTNG